MIFYLTLPLGTSEKHLCSFRRTMVLTLNFAKVLQAKESEKKVTKQHQSGRQRNRLIFFAFCERNIWHNVMDWMVLVGVCFVHELINSNSVFHKRNHLNETKLKPYNHQLNYAFCFCAIGE